MEPEKPEIRKCTECRRQLDLGVDTIAIDRGVIGPRGFVSLDEPKFLCDDDCLRRYVVNGDIKELPRRIP